MREPPPLPLYHPCLRNKLCRRGFTGCSSSLPPISEGWLPAKAFTTNIECTRALLLGGERSSQSMHCIDRLCQYSSAFLGITPHHVRTSIHSIHRERRRKKIAFWQHHKHSGMLFPKDASVGTKTGQEMTH